MMVAEDFDEDGYPTEEALERIRTWPTETFQDMINAMDYAGSLWSYPEYWEKEENYIDKEDFYPNRLPVVRYVFSTGGWSGNESVIGAIEKNMMLQLIGAWSWHRGGHYEYRFPVPGD